MKNQRIVSYMNETIRRWVVHRQEKWREGLEEKRGGKRTGQISESLDAQYHRATVQGAATIKLMFLEAGRYIDMRNVKYSEGRPVENIMEWVEAVGVEKFMRKARKYNTSLPAAQDKLIKKIAWGIKIGEQKKHHRKRWYSKPVWSDIYGLFDELMVGVSDIYQEEIKKDLPPDGSTT